MRTELAGDLETARTQLQTAKANLQKLEEQNFSLSASVSSKSEECFFFQEVQLNMRFSPSKGWFSRQVWESLTLNAENVLPSVTSEHLVALEWASLFALCNVEKFTNSRSVMLNSVWKIISFLEGSTEADTSVKADLGRSNFIIPVLGFSIVADEDALSVSLLRSIDQHVKKVVVIVNGVDERVLQIVEEAGNVLEGKVRAGLVAAYSIRHFPNQIGCAGGWNQIVYEVPDAEYWLILNNDVHFEKGNLGRAAAFVEEVMTNGERTHLIHIAPNYPWSAFALTRQGVADIGLFDENIFPAFYEDTDFASRGAASVVSKEAFAVHGDQSGHSRFTSKAFHEALSKSGQAAHNQLFWGNKIGLPAESNTGENGILVVPDKIGYVSFTQYHNTYFNRSQHDGMNTKVTFVDPLRRLCTYRSMCSVDVRLGDCAAAYLKGKFLWDASYQMRGVVEELWQREMRIATIVGNKLKQQWLSEAQCCQRFPTLQPVCFT